MAYVPLARRSLSWVSLQYTPEQLPTCTVIEQDDLPQDTGIFDANGTRLYRIAERRPIGFDLSRKP